MRTNINCANGAIGVFDSGIGGLSVALAIRQYLPAESLIYVADTGHAPYGEKSDEYIYQRMHYITRHLLDVGAKAIVVACNTATTAAIVRLRADFPLPIIGVEPGIKPAVLASRSRVVGVLATPRTLLTPAFATLAERFAAQATVLLQPCPELVPLIENLAFTSDKMTLQLKRYIQPLLDQGADALVLGCTHYNFVAELIAEIVGPKVTLIRTEIAVAKQLEQRLLQTQLLAAASSVAADTFYTSGDLAVFHRQLQQLWPSEQQVLPV
ncbi:glutamate racemase [Alishewanella longhuensis]